MAMEVEEVEGYNLGSLELDMVGEPPVAGGSCCILCML